MDSNMIRVSALKIREFRCFKGVSVEFNKPITLIAGQNGTAKSTLLGMLAQPFSFGMYNKPDEEDRSIYMDNYHGMKLASKTDISGNLYNYTCDKVFRLSKKYDTPEKTYLYEVAIKGVDLTHNSDSPLKNKKIWTVGKTRKGKLRFVTGPGVDGSITHEAGEGNFPHPVIYLSLGRLLPLAEAKDCKVVSSGDKLTAEESAWYQKTYREIFSVVDEEVKSGIMDATGKSRSIVPIADNYDGESSSAGQDNISRLLTSLISFRRLKEDLGEKYRGGLFLVDELDATLHPSAQIKLMEVLVRVANELALQIVTTTHSMYLIVQCVNSALRKWVGAVHLQRVGSNIQVKSDATLDDITADLKNVATVPQKPRKKKVTVVLEDTVAVTFFKYLVKKSSALKGLLTIANIKAKRSLKKNAHISGQYLEIMADNASKIPELERVVFIPDGDMDWVSHSNNMNVIALPGRKAIEFQLYDMLKAISPHDDFWSHCLGTNYNKSVAIGNYNSFDMTDIKAVKKWYSDQKQFWGNGLSIVFDAYYDQNKEAVDDFLKKLESIVKRCLQ